MVESSETNLFNAGIRPAVNLSISVSRVGGASTDQIMKKTVPVVSVPALAQYRELAAFSQFASDLDDATRNSDHGQSDRTAEAKQRYAPCLLRSSLCSSVRSRTWLRRMLNCRKSAAEAALLTSTVITLVDARSSQTGGYNGEIEGKLKGILDFLQSNPIW